MLLWQIILDFPGYGYRRVTHALTRAGWCVNHKRVLRIMREESLLCQLKRRFVPTTDSEQPYPVSPHLVKGLEVDAPDVVWVADITSIRLPTRFVYQAAVLDGYSRTCVGWKLSKRIDTKLACFALEDALATREVKPGLIHHSDRGVQYASKVSVERRSRDGDTDQHVVGGQPVRQCEGGAVFSHLEARGGVSQALSHL
jgi:putative transposase